MLDYIVICLIALLGSGLTFFSGFGLGTLLVPVFTLFFPIELAIALTAIVHFLNNIFKLFLVGKSVNRSILVAFGIPAMAAAFLGAYVLTLITNIEPAFSYAIGEQIFYITPVKVTIAILLAVFALFDILPALGKLHFNQKYIPLGGLLSGFFGGLSGNQGALRTAFLVRAGLPKEAFIATGVAIAILIDLSRLSIYSTSILNLRDQINVVLLSAATLSAFAGAFIGNMFLKKITLKTLQVVIGVLLIIFSLLLALGIV